MRRFDPTRHLARLESSSRHLRQPPELVLPYLPPTPGGVVAEPGCGTGFFGRVLARYHRHRAYIGLDPSPAMLDHFRGSLDPAGRRGVSLVLSERERLPLADGSVELLFLANVLHELGCDRGILPELARVTTAGGHLFLVDWKRRPSLVGPPVFLRVSRGRAISLITGLGFRHLPLPEIYPQHYCLLFAKDA